MCSHKLLLVSFQLCDSIFFEIFRFILCILDAFSEENVWHLCHHIRENHPSKLEGCYAVFISNRDQTIPLWYQKSGREAGFVIWVAEISPSLNIVNKLLFVVFISSLGLSCHFHS